MSNREATHERLIKHIRNNYASVYLTIISVIVALALGDLFNQVRDIYSAGEVSVTHVLLWVKIIGAFSAIFSVWVGYCHIFITVSWILGIWDALSVMLLLIMLYLINTTVGLTDSAWWFWAMGAYCLSGAWILSINMQNAQSEAGLAADALPGPRSLPVFLPAVTGGLSMFFGFLDYYRVFGGLTEVLCALVITTGPSYWPFLWVKMWREGLRLPQR